MEPVALVVALPVTMAVLHLGALHPVEQALVLLVAFGPFVVLGLVVRRQRRRDASHEEPPRSE